MPGSIFEPLTHSLTTESFVARDLLRLLMLASLWRRAPAKNLLRKRPRLVPRVQGDAKPDPRFDAAGYGHCGGAHVLGVPLVNVKPDAFLRRRRKGFRLFPSGLTTLHWFPPREESAEPYAQYRRLSPPPASRHRILRLGWRATDRRLGRALSVQLALQRFAGISRKMTASKKPILRIGS
jgi:hypothetical protein